nr:probable aspartyl aminopeptidase [Tanacetum cinerariifolium]
MTHNPICDDDYDELNRVVADNGLDGGKPNESPNAITNRKHHSLLLQEFIISGRLDNLCMYLCSLKMLRCQKKSLQDESGVRTVALFDHEEAGSTSAQGAGSPVIFGARNRITPFFSSTPQVCLPKFVQLLEKTIQKCFLVSDYMAHALHPNYMDKHEENHQPKLHTGHVINFVLVIVYVF